MIEWLKGSFKVSRVCGDCIHYDRCYKHSVEYLKQNTLEQIECADFEEVNNG